MVLTAENLEASALASAELLGLGPSDRWLACMPLYHVGGIGIRVRSVLTGCAGELQPRFDAAAGNEVVGAGQVTFLSVVPTMLQRMLDDPTGDRLPGRLRCVLVGGGPIAPSLVERALARGIPVAPTYGLSEASSQVTVLSPHEAGAHPGSAGRPLPGVAVEVVDRDGRPLPPGAIGEIRVRGPIVADGRLDGPPERPGGWLATGDLGRLDGEGYLYVADRREDLIVTGGENVMPAEVEAALAAHPAVAEAAVYGLPDPEWGQAVCADVVVAPGAAVTIDALQAFVRSRIAVYKAPRRICFVDALPRTASGKVRRAALREGG